MNGYGSSPLGDLARQSSAVEKDYQPLTLRKQLEMEIKRLREMADKKQQMLELLDRAPDIEKFMDLSRDL